jgi:hypothetical protein
VSLQNRATESLGEYGKEWMNGAFSDNATDPDLQVAQHQLRDQGGVGFDSHPAAGWCLQARCAQPVVPVPNLVSRGLVEMRDACCNISEYLLSINKISFYYCILDQ